MKEPVVVPTLLDDEEFLPVYGSKLAAGADVKACIEADIVIEPGASKLIPTGLKFAIPEGYEIQVRPRSGLALKNQITVLNTPGTIDADYRGEIGVLLINFGNEPFTVRDGDRIAQLVIARVFHAVWEEVDDLPLSGRQEGGFGHTGR